MIAKFLFGMCRVVPTDKEDTLENSLVCEALIMVRKTDLFQHSDMRKNYVFSPHTGGFVKDIGKQGAENFYGESVSCRVLTDQSMLEVYHPLTKNGAWFKHNYIHNGRQPMTVFIVVEPGHYPSIHPSEVVWEPVQYERIAQIMSDEIQQNSW